MAMPSDLVLGRHGRSEINDAFERSKSGDESGYTPEMRSRPDAIFRLTDTGIAQAKIAGTWLKERFIPEYGPFDAHIVSGFVRACETAGHLGLPGAKWKVSLQTHERSWGTLVGYPQSAEKTTFKDSFAKRGEDPLFECLPGGESIVNAVYRAEEALDEIAREYPKKRVLLMTHGEMMWCFRIAIEDLAPWQFREMYFSEEGRIRNCQMIHYSRRHPESGVLGEHMEWMRTVSPIDSPEPSPWKRIERRLWTNEELLEIAGRTNRLIHH